MSQISAHAFGFADIVEVGEGESRLAVPRFCPTELSAACDPESIETGIDCGMDWMCGISPCLCGSSDSWGCCSCNGLEDTYPQVRYSSSDETVVRVVEAFGKEWLVPVGSGSATLSCTASLIHYSDTTAEITVDVDGPTLADGVLGATLLCVVAALFAVVFGVRSLLRRRARIKAARRGAEAGEEEDL